MKEVNEIQMVEVIYRIHCVLLCFIKPLLGNRYSPGVSSWQQTSDNNLGVAGFSPFTLIMYHWQPIEYNGNWNIVHVASSTVI